MEGSTSARHCMCTQSTLKIYVVWKKSILFSVGSFKVLFAYFEVVCQNSRYSRPLKKYFHFRGMPEEFRNSPFLFQDV